jgi:DNA-directed RNA polymerase subunit N
MIIPVRCFTCGRLVASDYEKFKDRTAAGEASKAVLDDLKVERFCCRRMILSHVELLPEAARFD